MEAEAEAEAIRVSYKPTRGTACRMIVTIQQNNWRFVTEICETLLQVKGEAEAFAVEAKGRAEAEQMSKKAEAFQEYKDGAMVDMLLEKLPLVRSIIFYLKILPPAVDE